jgi:23S rRNA (uracil1939-C5)-methyltransferase
MSVDDNMAPGDRLTLTIEKAAAGGRMLARYGGAVLLVSGCIPGEQVEATVERVQRGTIWAKTTRIIEPSPDRVEPFCDPLCGGSVFAHVRYARQLELKRDILRDAFARIGKMVTPERLPIVESPVDGYRMRARLHVDGGRLGFFREGTHRLCDPEPTRQLLPATIGVVKQLQALVAAVSYAPVAAVELSENVAASERAFHLELAANADPSRLGSLPAIDGAVGVSCSVGDAPRALTLWGAPSVHDSLSVGPAGNAVVAGLVRHARSFFQGNRFLVADLVTAVMEAIRPGRVLDLYAGVGLFAVPLGMRGDEVTAIEGDRQSADDLKANAAAANAGIASRHQTVEAFFESHGGAGCETVIVDPPRTGMTRTAINGVVTLRAPSVIYVSCDVATLARDARTLVDAGYRLDTLRGFDMFPNTAHVESVAVFRRERGDR